MYLSPNMALGVWLPHFLSQERELFQEKSIPCWEIMFFSGGCEPFPPKQGEKWILYQRFNIWLIFSL
jgi:hypothetical protein